MALCVVSFVSLFGFSLYVHEREKRWGSKRKNAEWFIERRAGQRQDQRSPHKVKGFRARMGKRKDLIVWWEASRKA